MCVCKGHKEACISFITLFPDQSFSKKLFAQDSKILLRTFPSFITLIPDNSSEKIKWLYNLSGVAVRDPLCMKRTLKWYCRHRTPFLWAIKWYSKLFQHYRVIHWNWNKVLVYYSGQKASVGLLSCTKSSLILGHFDIPWSQPIQMIF